MRTLNAEAREDVLRQLETPGPASDALITDLLDLGEERAYSSDTDVAMTLVPESVHFLTGRPKGSPWFWCDIGYRPQVQAWGKTIAAAIAAAAVAYRTHPKVAAFGPNPNQRLAS